MRSRFAVSSWIFLLLPFALISQPSSLTAQSGSFNPPSEMQIRERAANLLRQMTLEEKIAQLSQLPGFPIPGFIENAGHPMVDVLKQNGAGSILWVSDPKEINRLQHVAVEQTRLHIPVLFGLDV